MFWYTLLLCLCILNIPICQKELHARKLNISFVTLDEFSPYCYNHEKNVRQTSSALYIPQIDNADFNEFSPLPDITTATSSDVFITPTIIFGYDDITSFATIPGPQIEHQVCYIVSSNPTLYENDLESIHTKIFANTSVSIEHKAACMIRLSINTENPNFTAETILFSLYKHLQKQTHINRSYILVLVCDSPQETSSLICNLIKLYTQRPLNKIKNVFVITPDLCYIPSSLLQENKSYIMFHRLPYIDEWKSVIDNTIISQIARILNRPLILHNDTLLYFATHPILQNVLMNQTLVSVRGNVSSIADILWKIAKEKTNKSTEKSDNNTSLHIELADIIEHCLYFQSNYFDQKNLSTLYKIESYYNETIEHYYNIDSEAPINTYKTYFCYDCESGKNLFSVGNIFVLKRLNNKEEATSKNLAYVKVNNMELWYVADDINIMNIKDSLITALSAVERYRTEELPNISISPFATDAYMLSVIPHHVPAIFYEKIHNTRNMELSLAILLCAPLLNIDTTSIASMGMLDIHGNLSGPSDVSTDLEQAMNLLYHHKNPIIIATQTYKTEHAPNIPTTYLSKYRILYASHINEVFKYLHTTLTKTNLMPIPISADTT